MRGEKALANGWRLCTADPARAVRRLADDTLLAYELVDRCEQAQLAAAWRLVEAAERRAQACRRVAWAYQRLAQAGSFNAEDLHWLAVDNRATAEILDDAIAFYRRVTLSSADPGEP